MVTFIIAGLLGVINMILWGLYGDLLIEKMSLLKIVRSLVLGILYAVFLYFLDPALPLFIVALIVTSLERITTEIYKALIRHEDQEKYDIPSDLNIQYPPIIERITGVFIIFSVLILLWNIEINISKIVLVIFAGFFTAISGVSKDARYEGFDIKKFFRSPIFAIIAGSIIMFLFPDLREKYFLLAILGGERIFSEFYKKIFRGNVPGKFEDSLKVSEVWKNKRRMLLPIYFLDMVFLAIMAVTKI